MTGYHNFCLTIKSFFGILTNLQGRFLLSRSCCDQKVTCNLVDKREFSKFFFSCILLTNYLVLFPTTKNLCNEKHGSNNQYFECYWKLECVIHQTLEDVISESTMSKNLICVHLVVDLEHAELDLELDPSFCSLRLDLLEKLLRKHGHDSWIDDFRKQKKIIFFNILKNGSATIWFAVQCDQFRDSS